MRFDLQRFIVLALILFLLPHPWALSEFRLLDAIGEFGEKRFVKDMPTRLKMGPLKVHPFIKNSVTYDDNILLEDNDDREDIIFNINPGVVLELPVDKHQLAVGYEADFEVFSKSRDANQNDQNQNFFALVDLHFPNFYINVLEKLSETSSRSGTTFTERIPRIQQSIHPKIGYRWKRTVFEAGFRHLVRDYRRSVNDDLDFQIAEWSGVVYYDLFANLKALLEYQVGYVDYDDNYVRNSTYNQIRAGFEGKLLPNLTVKARTGVQFRNYEEDKKPDYNSWVAEVILEYQIRNNLKLEVFFNREPVEATFGDVNYYLEHAFGGGFEYNFRPEWIIFSELKIKRQHYAERATVRGDTRIRRDTPLRLETGIRYLFRDWLHFEIVYQFLHRESNFSTLEYSDNRFIFSTTLSY